MGALPWLLGFLVSHVLTSFIFKLLGSLGIGYAVFSGIDVLMDTLNTYIQSQIANTGQLGPAIVQMLGVLRVADGLNLILSAVSVRYLFLGAVGGSIRKFSLTGDSNAT